MTDTETRETLVSIDGVHPDELSDPEARELVAQVHSFVMECTGARPDSVSVLDAPGVIRAAELGEEMPDGWRVEANGDGAVHAYPTTPTGAPMEPQEAPASFGISHDEGHIYTATMSVPSDRRGGFHDLKESVHGLKTRCIDWVAEKAEEADDGR